MYAERIDATKFTGATSFAVEPNTADTDCKTLMQI